MTTGNSINLHGQSTVNAPIALEAGAERTGLYTRYIRPLSSGTRFFLVGQIYTSTCIACLFFWSAPFTVAHLVMPLIVFPFQRVRRRWSQTHVSQELFKRLIAKFNAAFAVIVIRFIVGVLAPFFGTVKNIIFNSFRVAVGFVRPAQSSNVFALQTPTRLRVSVLERCRPHRRERSAYTFTSPKIIFRCSTGTLKGCQAKKLLPLQILSIWYSYGVNIVSSHYRNLLNRFMFRLGSSGCITNLTTCLYFTTQRGLVQ